MRIEIVNIIMVNIYIPHTYNRVYTINIYTIVYNIIPSTLSLKSIFSAASCFQKMTLVGYVGMHEEYYGGNLFL